MSKKSILIVDDDSMILEIFKDNLEDLSLDVKVAFQTSPFKIILNWPIDTTASSISISRKLKSSGWIFLSSQTGYTGF